MNDLGKFERQIDDQLIVLKLMAGAKQEVKDE
jgi:hypothetical protein